MKTELLVQTDKLVFFGDVIGGPLAPVFGPAIIDVDLKQRRGGRQSLTFTHTKYWALDEASRIAACREAVNLLDRPSPDGRESRRTTSASKLGGISLKVRSARRLMYHRAEQDHPSRG